MKLYFIPFACSLAARIALIEAELDAEFVAVTPGGNLPDGRPFSAVSPMGYVPALETRGGLALSEGQAVLTYIADLAAEGVLAPPPYTDERYQMIRWINFVATEIHKGIFAPLMTTRSSEGARDWARSLIDKRFALLSDHLDGQEYLLGSFSVADAYLLAVLNWCEHAGVAIADWPVLLGWRTAMRARPSVAQAMATEMPLRQAA
jgi:glutathione S-transferase